MARLRMHRSGCLKAAAAFAALSRGEGLDSGVAGHADGGDGVQGGVGVAVSAAEEAMAGGLARRRGDWCRATQGREGCLTGKAFGVPAGGDQ